MSASHLNQWNNSLVVFIAPLIAGELASLALNRATLNRSAAFHCTLLAAFLSRHLVNHQYAPRDYDELDAQMQHPRYSHRYQGNIQEETWF